MQEDYKAELLNMVKNEIITKVDEPTEFVNPVVIVRRPDKKLRVCLDPLYLNKCLLREHFRLPTFEEVSGRMAGAKIFSILDATNAFWQIQLSDRSSKLTTLQTPYGRYRYLRMPYGIRTEPEIFQKSYSEIFKDIPNVEIYVDDIIIWATNQKEHAHIFKMVFERAKECGIKFKREKCRLGVNKVAFLGHTFSDKGIVVDDKKVEAITKMDRPRDVKSVERLLGMTTYVSKFVNNLASITTPLRELIKKDMKFEWKVEHEVAFNSIKTQLSKSSVLQYYDVNKECKVSVDASSTGVGAVLLQNDLWRMRRRPLR